MKSPTRPSADAPDTKAVRRDTKRSKKNRPTDNRKSIQTISRLAKRTGK